MRLKCLVLLAVKLLFTFLFVGIDSFLFANNESRSQINARGDSVKSQMVHMDIFGPIYYPLRQPIGIQQFRFSAEYLFRPKQTRSLHVVVDAEWRINTYRFARWYYFPPGFPGSPAWSEGETTQHDFAVIAGCRYSYLALGNFGFFIEPRFAYGLRHAVLRNFLLGYTWVKVNQPFVAPRLRIGISWIPQWRIGAEFSLEMMRYRFVGDGRASWQVIPELNLGISF